MAAARPIPAGMTCPGDEIVWVNTRSGIFRLPDGKWFGRTLQGRFECEKQALADGFRETKSGD